MDKEPQVDVRDFEEKDYAGIIAIIAWAGFLGLMGICIVLGNINALQQIAAILGTPMGLITGFYFGRK